jgi:integration host factor subunit alpha
MALSKAQIVSSINKATGIPRLQATELVEVLLETIKSALESGDDVLVSGFGKFCVKDKSQRRGRNPATGSSMTLEPRRVVTFKCSGKLRDRVN